MRLKEALCRSSHWSWWLGLVLALPGLLLRNVMLVSLAGMVLPLGFVLDDISRSATGGITPMTAYSSSAAIMSFANTAALLAANSPQRWEYYLYVSEPYVFLAMALSLAAGVVPPLVFRAARSSRTIHALQDLLPHIRGDIPDRQLVVAGVGVGLAISILHLRLPVGSLGALGDVVLLVPLFVIFVLARVGTERDVPFAIPGALAVAVVEAGREAMYGYMRGSVAVPIVAFVLGAFAGARSLRPLRTRAFVPIYIFATLFVIYFGAFGAVRSTYVGGLQRFERMQDYRGQMGSDPDLREESLLSRLSTINQLSQIGRIANEQGFLHGQTLEYLWFAFIPRFLWPGKPQISKSAWFALNIGLAYVRPDGTITNAVNMTIPGELYLNYGWYGVLIGLAGLGLVISTFWRTTDFWTSSRNVFGAAFAFYLTWPWIGFSLGADLAIVVTLVAVYLLLLAIGWVLPALRGAPHDGLARSSRPRSA